MSPVGFLDPALAVAGALVAEDFAALAQQGFKTVISNRVDGEEQGQLTARQEAVLAWRAGLTYRHVPAAKHEVLEAHVIDALAEVLASVPGPVLLHCKSGLRSTIIWAAVAIRNGAAIDDVMATSTAAGFDLEALRGDIQASVLDSIALPDRAASVGCRAVA